MTKRFTTGMAQIDPRFILWRKIRVPLALGITALILAVTALLLYSYIVARGIRRDLQQAAELAATDTFESHGEALEILERIEDDAPAHEGVRAQHAWHRVLLAVRFGATPERLAAAREALARAEGVDPTPQLAAARGGMALLEGDAAAALRAVGERPDTCEGLYIRGMALARQAHVDQALVALDQARQGVPTFVPALSELALLLRQRGRLDEAEAALEVIRRASPLHQDAVVQGVLLALDRSPSAGRGGGSAGAEEIAAHAPELSKRLAGLRVDDRYPTSLAYKSFAVGRLALVGGDVGAAEAALAEAARVLDTNQAVATWLAVARHRAGEHEEALEALARYPDDASSDPALLETRLEILMALHRTTDARAPLDVLAKAGRDVTLDEGRLLFYAGDAERALAPLRRSLAAGHAEAGLLLAEALVALGRAGDARTTLRGLKGQGPETRCAEGYLRALDGETRPAREALRAASKAGARCGPVLLGRLLATAGGADGQDAPLAAALEQREDVRDRVTLGRVKLRTAGQAAAKAELDAVKALRPQGAIVLRELALAYLELGEAETARAVVTGAVAPASGADPLVVALAARLAREANDLAGASKLIEQGLKAHPSAPAIQLERAALLFEQNRFPDASDAVGEALQPGTSYAEAACLRSEIQLRRGERETAQIDLNRAILPAKRHSGASAEVAIRQCLVESHLKRGPASLGRAKTALYFLRQLPVEDAHIEYLTGLIAEREARQEEASVRYRKAVELDATHREAWKRLARLQPLAAGDRQRVEKIWPGTSITAGD